MSAFLAFLISSTAVLLLALPATEVNAARPVCDQHCKGGCTNFGPNRCDKMCRPMDLYRLDRYSRRCVPRCLGAGRHCVSCTKRLMCDRCEPNYLLVTMGKKRWRCVAIRRRPLLPLVTTIQPPQTENPAGTVISDVTAVQPIQTDGPFETVIPGDVTTESMQTEPPLPTGTCNIVSSSYCDFGGALACNGISDQLQRSTVVINGATVLTMFYCNDRNNGGVKPGVRLLTVDPTTCNVLGIKAYATGESAADATALANDLTNAASGTLLVAATAFEPSAYISSAVSAMSSVCNVDISSLGNKGSFAFVCQVGYKSKTKSKVINFQSAPAASVTATVTGTGAGMVIT